MARRKRKRSRGRARRRSGRILVVALVLPLLPIALLRWVDPPTSAFMLRERWTRCDRIDRSPVPWERIAPAVPLAVMASEDQRFPFHAGFDVEAIGDALEEASEGGRLRGASTISQQLVKNLFLWPEPSWVRKSIEVPLTVLLELALPKRRILELYLNTAQFGPCVFGVEAAAHRYFGQPAATIDLWQASALAAVLPSPRRLRVVPPSDHVRERAAWIRGQVGLLGGRSYLRHLE